MILSERCGIDVTGGAAAWTLQVEHVFTLLARARKTEVFQWLTCQEPALHFASFLVLTYLVLQRNVFHRSFMLQPRNYQRPLDVFLQDHPFSRHKVHLPPQIQLNRGCAIPGAHIVNSCCVPRKAVDMAMKRLLIETVVD